VTDGKKIIAFFHVLRLFIGKKHVLSKKKNFKIFGVKPMLLDLLHSEIFLKYFKTSFQTIST
jgi:hypothetical protein